MKLDKKNYVITSSDGITLKHEDKEFATLVSNLSLFNDKFSVNVEGGKIFPELKQWNDSVGPNGFPDDSDYSNKKTLEEIINENYDPSNPPPPNLFYDCIIPVEQIWSSDSRAYDPILKLKGNDRPYKQTEDWQSHLKDLRQINPITGKENKGFIAADCMKLAGKIRVTKNEDGSYNFTVVKTEGNGRFVKKMITNFDPKDPSKKIYLPFTIFFHPQDASLKDMNKSEAGQHHVDAEQRMTQNEGEKFSSGIAMGNPASIYCKEFLIGLKLDFQGNMNAERESRGEELWPEVSAIGRINMGEGKGMFSNYSKKGNTPGYKFTRLGFETARYIQQNITKEDKVSLSAARVFASMYHSFCTTHSTTQVGRKQSALFTPEQLQNYFYEFFEANQYDSKNKYKKPTDAVTLKSLSVSGGIKSLEYLATEVFFKLEKSPTVGRWWLMNTSTKDGQPRSNAFTAEHDCAVNFIQKADRLLRAQMQIIINSN